MGQVPVSWAEYWSWGAIVSSCPRFSLLSADFALGTATSVGALDFGMTPCTTSPGAGSSLPYFIPQRTEHWEEQFLF